MALIPKPANVSKPKDLIASASQIVQNPPDTTDLNAHVPLGPKEFGPEAGPRTIDLPRTTRARQRSSF